MATLSGATYEVVESLPSMSQRALHVGDAVDIVDCDRSVEATGWISNLWVSARTKTHVAVVTYGVWGEEPGAKAQTTMIHPSWLLHSDHSVWFPTLEFWTPEAIRSLNDCASFLAACLVHVGDGFHPDTPFGDYVHKDGAYQAPSFSGYDADRLDACMDRVFRRCGDPSVLGYCCPYRMALDAWDALYSAKTLKAIAEEDAEKDMQERRCMMGGTVK